MPADPSLLKSLQQGGYILYVRHGDATVGADSPSINFNDCSTQRNLSEAGRSQAVSYGNALRQLHIPVQVPVVASPFCRTKETAELAFGAGNVRTDPFWVRIYQLGGSVPPAQQEAVLQALSAQLEIPPPPGTNKVIMAHSFPPGVGLGEIKSVGTVVIKPKGQGNGYDIAGRFDLDELNSP
ncbi:histidine phosphatase family protein [Paenibacillus sp. ATY16]|uniref:histidine phosphatase family protein n=1 Tax=Paenibacillus sp. ATY16 TaxID=1759312 RepID=UPI00200CA740|nr:histidine phosphatase family protein [Paenibacillus sp. ATY16]MCK9857668.1 histidine phosphatase family protein [Paenibacillus sp. ATY16]